jgi:hypothetical protein
MKKAVIMMLPLAGGNLSLCQWTVETLCVVERVGGG